MKISRVNHRPSIKFITDGKWAVYCLNCSALRGSLIRCKSVDSEYPKYLSDSSYKDTVEQLQYGKRVNDNVVRISRNARDTSRAAARAKEPRSGTQKRMIYDLISEHNGLTDDEIEIMTGLTHQSASSSRNALMNDGFVIKTDERRRTRQGEKAIVWRVVDEDQAQ